MLTPQDLLLIYAVVVAGGFTVIGTRSVVSKLPGLVRAGRIGWISFKKQWNREFGTDVQERAGGTFRDFLNEQTLDQDDYPDED